ncbi:MAG: hypothetical protein ACXIVQ_14975 [Acidimicrobiales bacterium]
MVALTQDHPRHTVRISGAPAPVLRLAPRREPAEPQVVVTRALLAILAVVLVVAVAVGSAAFGRMLDSQRGIPADPVATAAP